MNPPRLRSCDSVSLARSWPRAWLDRQALATLAGFRSDLIEGDNGHPMLAVSRWAMSRLFASTAEFDRWLARVAPGLAAGAAS